MLSLISKLTILHNIFSRFIISLPVFFTHNFSKYMNIKNAFYNLSLDQITGDCIEFGVFTGSSFKHAIRVDAKFNKKYATKNKYILPVFKSIKFVIAIEKIRIGTKRGSVKILVRDSLLFLEMVIDAVIDAIKTMLKRESDRRILIFNK